MNSTVSTSPFFTARMRPPSLVNAASLYYPERWRRRRAAASCASLSNQRQIMFFGFMLVSSLCVPSSKSYRWPGIDFGSVE